MNRENQALPSTQNLINSKTTANSGNPIQIKPEIPQQ